MFNLSSLLLSKHKLRFIWTLYYVLIIQQLQIALMLKCHASLLPHRCEGGSDY